MAQAIAAALNALDEAKRNADDAEGLHRAAVGEWKRAEARLEVVIRERDHALQEKHETEEVDV